MSNLGYKPFAEDHLWFVRSCERRYATAMVGILKGRPGLSDLQVGNALVDYFRPDRLSIDDPVTTELSWAPSQYRAGGDLVDRYLHVASIPFDGTKHLWRLNGSLSHRFQTRLGLSDGSARMRLLLPDRDVEQFREIVMREIGFARELAASQEGAVTAFMNRLVDSIDTMLKYTSLMDHREEANRLRAIEERSRRRRGSDDID